MKARQSLALLILLVLWDGLDAQIAFFPTEAEAEATCITPDQLKGECVGLRKCRPLLNLLRRPVPPRVIQHLRQSVCGFRSNIPDVCCPIVKPLRQTVTR